MTREEYMKEVSDQQVLADREDIEACFNVYKLITNNDVFSDEEVFDNTFLWAKKNQNIFCMLDLAHYYRDGEYVHQSFFEYTMWLSKIADSAIAERALQFWKFILPKNLSMSTNHKIKDA